MGRPQSQALNHSTYGNNNNLYPKELQLKLYQALIFSIPILFSIILFLLFYLFYLKRRASNLSSSEPPSQLPIPSTHSSSLTTLIGIKGDLKDKLQVVHFDEQLRARDSQCCVCLGEFELKEELQQVSYCKHIFHTNCIRSWLQKNATCPLCRCHVITSMTNQPPHQPGNGGDGNRMGQGLVGGWSDMVHLQTEEEHVLHIEEQEIIVR